ncbi:MAG: class I SAM-dependent methyltransferase [Rhodobacter sp.]|nr:class I SAM-dependent methyltransferase [Rhodobacter sp.]
MSEAQQRWDRRFAGQDYLFGTAPAAFMTLQAGVLTPGSLVLAVADGEGRNSVWLAGQGMRVTAMDSSPVGQAKARALAARNGVSIDFRLGDVATWDWQATAYDAVVAIFVQFAGPDLRAAMFKGFDQAMKPGGLLLLHGYAPRQVGYGTGGPAQSENMYELPMLHTAFAGYDVLHEVDHDAVIDEGTGHSGCSALIDFVARKPKGI